MYDCIRLAQGQGYLRWFLQDGEELPLILSDNKAALALSKTSVATKKSKHYALRYMLVRDHFRNFGYVPTDLNLSDPLTKPLPAKKYIQIFHHGGANGFDELEDDEYETAHSKVCFVDFRNYA